MLLDKDIFFKGIDKLNNEFETKGFKMTKERASQWYSYMKDISEKEYNKRIDYVLKNCTYGPTMADILKADIQGIKINAAAYEHFKFD